MEQRFLSALSLFDFLAILIPGGALMAIIGEWLGFSPFELCICTKDKFFVYSIILVVAYLIGIAYTCLMDFFFKGYRDSTKFMMNALKKVYESNQFKSKYQETFQELTGYTSENIKRYGHPLFDNIQCLISCVLFCLYRIFNEKCNCLLLCWIKSSQIGQDHYIAFKRKYYEAYYYVSQHSASSSITVMESQVAFIRNMLIPLLLITIDIGDYFVNFCKYQFLCFVLIYFLLSAMISRQNKIYERVWEDCIYLKILEKK